MIHFAEPVFACDVSGWQRVGACDWHAAYEAGCVLVIVKRSQRSPSKKSRGHVQKIAQSPVSRGDYHFADTKRRRDRRDPMRQVETFCREVGDLKPGDGIPWLDLEWLTWQGDVEAKEAYYRDFSRVNQTEWALAWLAAVERKLGVWEVWASSQL